MTGEPPPPETRSFPADPTALTDVRRFVRSHAEKVLLPPEAAEDLALAVSEACANAVRHTPSRQFTVGFRRVDDSAEVTIEDQGVFRRPTVRPGVARTSGRGIPLMLALVDEVSITEGSQDRRGTLVRLLKRKAG
ncbi:MAG: ATP-binding protein [Actinobacteria bacterium]|nr:ATP-binding protein [Actinomycetota bacterium]